VSTELTALRADVAGLADSVRRLALESPELARDTFESWIRRKPLQATLVAAGAGFFVSLLVAR
jgi:ElaB/YqjD/DUF883 family membrane-anchored ribosome-binding protein